MLCPSLGKSSLANGRTSERSNERTDGRTVDRPFRRTTERSNELITAWEGISQ
jgi:hypothetical protein